MGLRGILRVAQDNHLLFWCPGCKELHMVRAKQPGDTRGWDFDGNYDKPTFMPSVLVRGGHYLNPGKRCWCDYRREHPEDKDAFECSQCHSFVINGRIQFLSDCSHALAGQTVDLIAPPTEET